MTERFSFRVEPVHPGLAGFHKQWPRLHEHTITGTSPEAYSFPSSIDFWNVLYDGSTTGQSQYHYAQLFKSGSLLLKTRILNFHNYSSGNGISWITKYMTYGTRNSIPYSQGLSNYPCPEPNQSNSSSWHNINSNIIPHQVSKNASCIHWLCESLR